MYINLFDSHIHTDNSFDGVHSLTFLCEKAVEKGLSGLCVTDHCELRDYEKGGYAQRIAQSAFDAKKCRAVFSGRLAVMTGIELSDVYYDEALTDRVLESVPFDMVMVSQHTDAEGADIFYTDYSAQTSAQIADYLEFYFSYLLRVAKGGKFDTLGHLTYPVRYIVGTHKVPLDLGRYDDLVEAVLREVAAQGKAIELNTSGLAGELGDTIPSMRYVRRYRELGGEYITLGSDAHTADAVGAGIRVAMQMLADAGFSYFTFYKQRQPLQLKLI